MEVIRLELNAGRPPDVRSLMLLLELEEISFQISILIVTILVSGEKKYIATVLYEYELHKTTAFLMIKITHMANITNIMYVNIMQLILTKIQSWFFICKKKKSKSNFVSGTDQIFFFFLIHFFCAGIGSVFNILYYGTGSGSCGMKVISN